MKKRLRGKHNNQLVAGRRETYRDGLCHHPVCRRKRGVELPLQPLSPLVGSCSSALATASAALGVDASGLPTNRGGAEITAEPPGIMGLRKQS